MVRDDIHPLAVPGIGHAAVGEIREGHARVGIRPAIGGADAAVAEDARRGEGSQPANGVRGPPRVRAEPAVHGHAHEAVDPVSGEVARDVGDHGRGEQPHAVEDAAVGHHLIEGGHGPRGPVASAARRTGAAELGVVLVGALHLAPPVARGLMDVRGAALLGVGQADEELVAEPERLRHVGANEVAVVGLGHRLDQGRGRPVRGEPVIVHARTRRPLEREPADGLAQEIMILPHGLGHLRVGEACLVGQQLDHRDIALGILLEARQVLGHAIREGERAPLDEKPHGACRDHLRVRVQQPEGVLRRRGPRRIDARVADRLEEGQLSVPGHRELGTRIASFGDVARDGLEQALEALGIEIERGGRGTVERDGHDGLLLRAVGCSASGRRSPRGARSRRGGCVSRDRAPRAGRRGARDGR